jgi:Na+/melibiose symporter-like transporter
MCKGFLNMDIKEFKKEFKKMRVPKMDISIDAVNNLNEFIQLIKKQDKEDEKYILHNKIFPILFGLFSIIIIMLFNPIKEGFMLVGHFLIFLGFFSSLILLFMDYRNISKESYDFSLLAYLKQKRDRLKSWRLTSAKYYLTFIVFVTGLIISNISLLRHFNPELGILLITVYLALFAISWIIGEYFYRKRHRKKHQPLLKIISEQIEELSKK